MTRMLALGLLFLGISFGETIKFPGSIQRLNHITEPTTTYPSPPINSTTAPPPEPPLTTTPTPSTTTPTPWTTTPTPSTTTPTPWTTTPTPWTTTPTPSTTTPTPWTTTPTPSTTTPSPQPPTPIVLWHGMGDSCCNPLSLGSFKAFLISALPGVYVKSLEVGDGIVEDTMNGFFMNVNKQVDEVCRLIATDSRLRNGYNAIGFSQGGQFLRAVAQRCPNGMKNLISFGGQHQGIYGLPHCMYPDHSMCDYIRILLDKAAYLSWVQNKFVQAQYWHDPINEDEYIRKSAFLADINNERNVNETYKQGLKSLNKLVLVKFADDTMVVPKESSWFGFYTPGQGSSVTDLQHSALYIEDRLGLREMDSAGKIEFLTSPGDHLRFTRQWFIDHIYKYLE